MPNFLNLRTKVLKMKKTSVLVLLSGLFDRSRSRTVTALVSYLTFQVKDETTSSASPINTSAAMKYKALRSSSPMSSSPTGPP